MAGQQRRHGGQPRPAKCYNCGSLEHFLTTCPEPTRDFPAGLAAALKSSQKSQSSHGYGEGQDHRPVKRQKTDSGPPVVTRYPAPSTGPVVTRYAPPPNADPAYASQSYYGAQPAVPYQQAPPYQNQQYGPHITQSTPGYPTYVQQPPYGQHPPYGQQTPYGQPMPAAAQYGHTHPAVTHPYGASQPYGQNGPQAAQYQYGTYPSGPAPQQYSYDGAQYGQPPPQRYPQYLNSPQPPVTFSHGQQPAPQWGQPPPTSQGYSGAPYQPGHQQYQQSFAGHHQNPPPQGAYQAPYTDPNFVQQSSASGPTMPMTMPASEYQGPVNPQQYPATPGSSHSTSHQSGYQAPPRDHHAADLVTEEQQFNWDFQKIFQEKKPQRTADPIASPLPAVFDQEPILPPAFNAKGVTCKYVRANNLEVFSRGVRQSLQWALLKSDPAFSDIDFESPLIPLDEVGKWAAERQEQRANQTSIHSAADSPQVFDQDDIEHQLKFESQYEFNQTGDEAVDVPSGHKLLGSDEHFRESRSGTPSFDRSSTPNLENPGTPILEDADDDAWAPQPGESHRSTTPTPAYESAVDSSDPTEAFLASLGVSGAPKPVLQKRSSFSLPAGSQREQAQDALARQPTRQDSGYASARGSYSKPTGHGFDYGNTQGGRQTYNQNQPPPPPPPPYSRKQYDGQDSSPSDNSAQGQLARCNSTNDTQNRGSSPLSPTSAELLSYEKQAFQDRPNGKKAEPQRQEDDVTPKMKRRQPKVADAYSRRW